MKYLSKAMACDAFGERGAELLQGLSQNFFVGKLELSTFWFVGTPNTTKWLSLRDLSLPQLDKPDKLSNCT
jgi:hypothetical protein